MKLHSLYVGMRIKHPQHGVGVVKSVSEHTADIRFDDETRTISPEQSNIEPADGQAEISGLTVPLNTLIAETVRRLVRELNLERDDTEVVEQLGVRWQKGTMVLRPADPSLQPKEIPLETFFHKIVIMRNKFWVVEQKNKIHNTQHHPNQK